MQPELGWLSDKVGRKVVYCFDAPFFAVYAFPLCWLLDTENPVSIAVALSLVLGIGDASAGSLHGVIYAEQYPTRYRFSGSSKAYQPSGIISRAGFTRPVVSLRADCALRRAASTTDSSAKIGVGLVWPTSSRGITRQKSPQLQGA